MNSHPQSTGPAAAASQSQSSAPSRGSLWRGFFPWALSLFFLGMGVKLALLHRCLNSLPYFDQWEAEGSGLYQPYLAHTLHFSDLFRAQGEHRIFLTNVYNLVLFLLNGQWDAQLQMVVNAIIHSATIAGFAWFMASLMGRRYWLVIWVPMAVAVMSLFTWENALWGFQSQFYFLLLFSLMTIALLSSEPLSPHWLLGLVAGAGAMLSMASGLLPFVAVGVVLILEIWKNPRNCPHHLRALGFCAAFAFAGLLLLGKSDSNKIYAAHSFGQFFSSLGKNLVWPAPTYLWLVPLNLFPLALFGWVFVRSPAKAQPAERIILGLGAWTILQSISTAVMRGSGGPAPTWRYMDTLCFLFTANLLSAALLLGKYRGQLRFPDAVHAGLVVWLICCICGFYTINKFGWILCLARLGATPAKPRRAGPRVSCHGRHRRLRQSRSARRSVDQGP